jgi:signal transduction histidine kinase
MRGKISVVSELNKGTVFIIEIPVEAEVALTVTG